LLPSAIAAPLAVWSLRRHRRPGQRHSPGNAPADNGPGGVDTDDTSQLVM
jgi:hypothetical protein